MILNGLPWKQTEIILLFLRLHPSTAFWTLADFDGYSISSKGFLPTVVDKMVIWVKFTHSIKERKYSFTQIKNGLLMVTINLNCNELFYLDKWSCLYLIGKEPESLPASPVPGFPCSCYCSVTKLCPTLCYHIDCSMLGFLVFHCLLEFAQIHFHWVSYAI